MAETNPGNEAQETMSQRALHSYLNPQENMLGWPRGITSIALGLGAEMAADQYGLDSVERIGAGAAVFTIAYLGLGKFTRWLDARREAESKNPGAGA